MVELLAFCWAMQSLTCCFMTALSLVPALLVLGASVDEGDVELGYWLGGVLSAGGALCDGIVCVCAAPVPQTARASSARVVEMRFTGPPVESCRGDFENLQDRRRHARWIPPRIPHRRRRGTTLHRRGPVHAASLQPQCREPLFRQRRGRGGRAM